MEDSEEKGGACRGEGEEGGSQALYGGKNEKGKYKGVVIAMPFAMDSGRVERKREAVTHFTGATTTGKREKRE